MFPRTFRATSTVITFWVAVGFAAVLVGDACLRGAWATVLAYLPPVLFVLWLLWLVLWRTSVRALPDRVIVTNLLRVHDVPWSRVVEVRQRGQVTLELDDSRQLLCWGGPFPTKPGVRSSSRRRPAESFAAVLDHYRGSAPPSSEPATRRWDLVALVPGIVLALAVIARIVLLGG